MSDVRPGYRSPRAGSRTNFGRGCRMLRSTGVQVPPGQTPPNSTVRTPQLGERTTHSESARSRLREALRSGTSGFVTGYPPSRNSQALSAEDTSTWRTPQLGERTTHSESALVSASGKPCGRGPQGLLPDTHLYGTARRLCPRRISTPVAGDAVCCVRPGYRSPRVKRSQTNPARRQG